MNDPRPTYLERLRRTAEALPTAVLAQLVDFAAYLRDRDEWAATRELLDDPGMRADVLEGREQAEGGEGVSWRELAPSG